MPSVLAICIYKKTKCAYACHNRRQEFHALSILWGLIEQNESQQNADSLTLCSGFFRSPIPGVLSTIDPIPKYDTIYEYINTIPIGHIAHPPSHRRQYLYLLIMLGFLSFFSFFFTFHIHILSLVCKSWI